MKCTKYNKPQQLMSVKYERFSDVRTTYIVYDIYIHIELKCVAYAIKLTINFMKFYSTFFFSFVEIFFVCCVNMATKRDGNVFTCYYYI